MRSTPRCTITSAAAASETTMKPMMIKLVSANTVPFPQMTGEQALEWAKDRLDNVVCDVEPGDIMYAVNTISDCVLHAPCGAVYTEALATKMLLTAMYLSLTNQDAKVRTTDGEIVELIERA